MVVVTEAGVVVVVGSTEVVGDFDTAVEVVGSVVVGAEMGAEDTRRAFVMIGP